VGAIAQLNFSPSDCDFLLSKQFLLQNYKILGCKCPILGEFIVKFQVLSCWQFTAVAGKLSEKLSASTFATHNISDYLSSLFIKRMNL